MSIAVSNVPQCRNQTVRTGANLMQSITLLVSVVLCGAASVHAQTPASSGAPVGEQTPLGTRLPASPETPTAGPAVIEVTPPASPTEPALFAVPAPLRLTNRDELAQIDARLEDLRALRAQHGLGRPIALMGVGFGSSFALAYVAFIHFVFTRSETWGDGGKSSRSASEVRTGRTLLGLSAIGVAVGIGGSVMLGKRVRQRNVYKPEIRSLRERRKELLNGVQYGVLIRPEGSAALTVCTRF